SAPWGESRAPSWPGASSPPWSPLRSTTRPSRSPASATRSARSTGTRPSGRSSPGTWRWPSGRARPRGGGAPRGAGGGGPASGGSIVRVAWLGGLGLASLFLVRMALAYWRGDVFLHWHIGDQRWGFRFYLDSLALMAVGFGGVALPLVPRFVALLRGRGPAAGTGAALVAALVMSAQAASGADEPPPPGSCAAAVERGQTECLRGEMDAALQTFEEAVTLAEAAGPQACLGQALYRVGLVLDHRGELARAAGPLDRAEALGRALGDQGLLARIWNHRGLQA